jgi:hypothetical protein
MFISPGQLLLPHNGLLSIGRGAYPSASALRTTPAFAVGRYELALDGALGGAPLGNDLPPATRADAYFVQHMYSKPPVEYRFQDLHAAFSRYLDAIALMLEKLSKIEILRR